MNNKKIGILVLITLLSVSNCVMADDNINFELGQNTALEKIKANKDTIAKAQEAMNNKDYQTAINLLTGYINEKQNKYEVYKMRGDAYYALRRYYMAQKDYLTAIDIKSSEDKFITNTKYVSAIVLGADKNEQKQNAELGDLYGALMYAQKATNNPNYTSSYDNAVKYNSHIYLPQPNKNEINKINCPQKYGKVLNPQGIDAKIYGAIDDIAKGNYNESLYKLQDVTGQYPNYYLGHYLTGVALSELEKDNDAIREFEKAISLNPYDFESRASLGRVYYSKAETTFSQADARKSIDYFNQALRQNQNCPTYYFYIGMNELQIGNTNVAISNFDKALKINPSDYNSMYYKLIAQYINGKYQDVIDGASNLLLKHVSNNNSVLYLRALAYTKTNDSDRALQDLNTIENNIGDIYNSDIKTTSAREKSLESYVHYLKAQIQHSKGAGAAEDNNSAYSNPIINRLANAQKAMEPYEKSLQGENISLSDYNKFESFYSTSLPKLLESGAVITYEDIDNQYDYIRTTFADLGISFLYENPNYKMTTIKDYPYKKYSSKLNKGEADSLSLRPESDMANVALAKAQTAALRKSTPASELIVQEGQSSIAQMLASNALAGKPKSVEIKEPVVLRDSTDNIAKPWFEPATPDAEKIDTSKNIASGEIYESEKPAINSDNNKKVTEILKEEKSIEKTVPTNIETTQDGSVKIAVKNPVQTPDIVIRNKAEISPSTSTIQNSTGQIEETTDKITQSAQKTTTIESMKFQANEIKQTENFEIKYPKVQSAQNTIQAVNTTTEKTEKAVNEIKDNVVTTTENAKLSAKEAKKLAKEQAKVQKQAAKEAAKLAKNKAKEKLKEEKQEAVKLAQETQKEIIKQEDSMRNEAHNIIENEENIIAEAQTATRKINEKHANIDNDINIQKPSNSLIIDDLNEIVELDTKDIDKKFGNESDLFDSNTVFTKPQAEIHDLTPPVTLPEEPVLNQQQPEHETANNSVPVVDVPEITAPQIRTEGEKNSQNIASEEVSISEPKQYEQQEIQSESVRIAEEGQPQQQITETQLPVQKTYTSQDELVKEQLSQMINKMIPTQSSGNTQQSASEVSALNEVAATINEAEALKAKRLKLKEEAKFAKAQKKALARKEKEEQKLQKEIEQINLLAQRDKIREQEKEQKNKEKLLIEKTKQELKQQKVIKQEEAKLKRQQTIEEAQSKLSGTEQATKSWLNSVMKKHEDNISESETEEVKTAKILKTKNTEKIAQQIRAEELKQAKKLEREKAKQQKALAKEQAKIAEQNDETKIQRLKAKLTAMRGSLTNAEKRAQKEQLKKERQQAKQAQKAKKLAQEISQISGEDYNVILQEQNQKAQYSAIKQEKEIIRQKKEQEKEVEKRIKQAQKAQQKAIKEAQKIQQKEQKAAEKIQQQRIKAEQKAAQQAQQIEQGYQYAYDTVSKAEQKAKKEAQKIQQKEQKAIEKAQREQQKAEQKAVKYAQKMAEKDRKAHEKTVNYYGKTKENIFSKLKFWKK